MLVKVGQLCRVRGCPQLLRLKSVANGVGKVEDEETGQCWEEPLVRLFPTEKPKRTRRKIPAVCPRLPVKEW